MINPLLATKLYIPPPQPEWVPRPRLINQLNAGTNCKLTLISAPAGFGKTTLLSAWVAQSRRPIAWVSLDKGDNDIPRFLAYLHTALQRINVDIGKSAQSMLHSPQIPPFDTLLTSLVNKIAETPEHFTLVLDDYHEITEKQVHELVALILDDQPPQMHVIISSRADPPWPLARMRGRGELSEIRAHDLRFTTQETATFLSKVLGFYLSPEDIATLEDRTEGWITGLQMAALSMQGREDVSGFIKSFSGTHRFILDYLVEEVLDHQHSDVKEFLLQTSILEQMTAPLCNAVTGRCNSQTILTQLEQANLFLIPLEDERRWFRYHSLFADLLRSRLDQIQPNQVSTLHRQASEWYEEQELITEAVSHALSSGDVERVARLVAGNAHTMIYYSELRKIVSWLDALPDEVVRTQPWLCVAHAWTLSYAGKFDSVEPLLQEAEKALAGLDEHIEGPVLSVAEGQRIVGHIASLRAYAAALRGKMSRAVEQAREALERLPAGDLMVRGYTTTLLGAVLRVSGDLVAAAEASTEAISISHAAGDNHLAVDVMCDLAGLHFHQGQLHKAAAACREAQRIADKHARKGGRPLPVMGYANIRISAVMHEWNDLENATRYVREGMELCKQWGQADVLIYGYIEMSKVLQAIGDTDGALEAIQKGKQIASNVSPWPGAKVAAQEARLWLAHGNLDAASRWVQEGGLSIDDKLNFQYLFRYIILSRVLIIQGELDKAVGLLARLLGVAETAGTMGYVIEILVLQAMALQSQGKIEQALNPLERALALSEPEGYVRTLIDEGIPMGKILRQAVVQGIAVGYAGKLLAALEMETKDRLGPRSASLRSMVEPLSERELQVLRLLNTHLSSREIASELVISVNTTRSHIKSIYSKLNVHNRKDAIQRAKELKLL